MIKSIHTMQVHRVHLTSGKKKSDVGINASWIKEELFLCR